MAAKIEIGEPKSWTDRKKCGCLYRSLRAPSVRKGFELGGYLVKRCYQHEKEFQAAIRSAAKEV